MLLTEDNLRVIIYMKLQKQVKTENEKSYFSMTAPSSEILKSMC